MSETSAVGDVIGMGTVGVTGIVEALVGSDMYYDAQDDLDKLLRDRPEYEIPEEIRAMVDMYKRGAESTRLPGQDIYEEQIYGSTAQGISASREAATSASDVLGATTSLYGQQTGALSELQIAAAKKQQEQEQKYAQSLETLGQYQDKAWNWNVATPYQFDLQRASNEMELGYEMWSEGKDLIVQSGEMAAGSGGSSDGGSSGANISSMSSSSDSSGMDMSSYLGEWGSF